MSQHPLYVMILWHMHQPYYKDINNQEYLMPWVRLHATKDYLDMPLLAGEYPDLRITFNMVPSLLEQIEDYAAGTAKDTNLKLATKKAEELDETERTRLLQSFFTAHYEHMIKPYPRYQQLHERRGWSDNPKDLRRTAQLFSTADLRDLQVWLYLSWIDPYLRERNPRLIELVKKDRMFSEQEKMEVLEIGRELTGQIIPALKELWLRGQIELSTTPYFHPILPLLVDTDIARRPRPKVTLPTRRFQHPEDARLQIELGLEYCEKLFGRRPTGMWPSEGSVCPELIPMFKEAGVGWIASDEDGLALSLGFERFGRDKDGVPENADALYRPYMATHGGSATGIFFRDHFLSDQIGFKYAHWNPRDAASDLIHRLEQVEGRLRDHSAPHVVSIILDGENCWEHYEQDGVPFLRALYQGLTSNSKLKTTTPSEFLNKFPDQRRLDNLHSGSWISHDFGIWIGHPEDNASWDLLSQAREDVGNRLRGERGALLNEESRRKALKSLLIAEGSDWNWWYGDENSTAFDEQFDALYRQHVNNAYASAGLESPGRVFIPICRQDDNGLQTHPVAFITPTLDGKVTNYFEWFSAGHFDPRRGGDSMHQVEYLIESMYFGFDLKNFYLRLDLSANFRQSPSLASAELIVYLFTQNNYKIVCPLGADPARPAIRVFKEDSALGWVESNSQIRLASGSIVEIAFPFEPFQIIAEKMLRFQAAIEVGEHEVERCPGRAPLSTYVPNADFEEIMWIV